MGSNGGHLGFPANAGPLELGFLHLGEQLSGGMPERGHFRCQSRNVGHKRGGTQGVFEDGVYQMGWLTENGFISKTLVVARR